MAHGGEERSVQGLMGKPDGDYLEDIGIVGG